MVCKFGLWISLGSNLSEDGVNIWASLKLFIPRAQESKEREKSFFRVAKEIILDIAGESFILYNDKFLPLVSLSLYHFFKIIFNIVQRSSLAGREWARVWRGTSPRGWPESSTLPGTETNRTFKAKEKRRWVQERSSLSFLFLLTLFYMSHGQIQTLKSNNPKYYFGENSVFCMPS